MTTTDSAPKKIAIYSAVDPVGDGLLRLHLAVRLRQLFPKAELVWLASNYSTLGTRLAELASPYIDRLITELRLGDKSAANVPTEDFDVVIDLQRDWQRSLAVKRNIRAKRFVSQSLGFLLSDVFPNGSRLRGLLWGVVRPVSMVQRYCALADMLVQEPPAPLPPVAHNVSAYDALAEKLLPANKKFLGFGAGAGDMRKVWPLKNYIALAKHYAKQDYVPVFFLGPNEAFMQKTITAHLPQAVFPEANPPAKPSARIPYAVAVAKRMSAIVANDSGLGHILAAALVPMVVIFRRGPPAKFSPHIPQLQTICLESYKTFGTMFAKSSMERIPVRDVCELVDRVLAK